MDAGEEIIWLLEVRKGIEKLDLFPVSLLMLFHMVEQDTG